MSALLKVYTDSGHSSEVAHTTQNSTTVPTGGFAAAATTLTFTAGQITNWPTQGYFDIVDSGKNETIAYYGKSGNAVNVANTGGLANAHSAGVTVNQWYYALDVGDQSNGILNDGSNAAPNSPTNVATWYCYNAGDQTAQSPTLTVNTSDAADTTAGKTDTLVSITSASASFGTSVSPANIAAGSQQQFWVVAEIPSGQSAAGNPQICVIDIAYQSV